MTRPIITHGFWVGAVLAALDLTRAHAWGTGEMGTYEHVGLLGHLPHHLVAALWTLAAILLIVRAARPHVHGRVVSRDRHPDHSQRAPDRRGPDRPGGD